MHFSALFVTALAGFTAAAPLATTLAVVEERGELQERGVIWPICATICALECAATGLACLACVALCMDTAADGGTANATLVQAAADKIAIAKENAVAKIKV